MRAALVVLVFLLAGCTASTSGSMFEQKFDQGLAEAYEQKSPLWRDPGLYDLLEGVETRDGFIIDAPQPPAMTVHPAGTPTGFSFQDADMDQAWGGYSLKLVRWKDTDDADLTRNVVIHVDPEGITGLWGLNVQDGQLRLVFRLFAEAVTGATGPVLDAMEEDFMDERHRLEAAPAGNGMRSLIDGYYSSISYTSNLRLKQHFTDLGGFAEFQTVPLHDPTMHLGWGQIDLVQGNWEFAFDTPARTAARGPFEDQDLLVVSPDDSVHFIHWGQDDLSDVEAAEEMREAVRALGRDAPDTTGWVFGHQTIVGGPG